MQFKTRFSEVDSATVNRKCVRDKDVSLGTACRVEEASPKKHGYITGTI